MSRVLSTIAKSSAGLGVLLAAVGILACQSPPPIQTTTVPLSGQAQRLSQDQQNLLKEYAGDQETTRESAASYGDAAEPAAGDNMVFVRRKVTVGGDRWPFVALDDPQLVGAEQADFLGSDDLVLGVFLGGEAKAYPTSMMWFHHVANDTIGGKPIAVAY